MEFKLHHLGCAVKNIETAIQYYTNIMGFSIYQNVFDYKPQNIKVAFLAMNDNTLLELVEGVNEFSPVKKIIDLLGGGVYHACYEVECLEETVQYLCNHNFIKHRKTQMENKDFKAVYMITPDNYLMELIELKNDRRRGLDE